MWPTTFLIQLHGKTGSTKVSEKGSAKQKVREELVDGAYIRVAYMILIETSPTLETLCDLPSSI